MATVTMLNNFDPTQMTFGTDFQIKEGAQFGSVRLTMPTLCIRDPLTSTWGVNSNFGENNRYPLELQVTDDIVSIITAMEDHTQKTFAENSRAWIKKDKKNFTFSRLIKDTEDGPVLKLKVDQTKTVVKTLNENNKVQTTVGTLSALNRFCSVRPFFTSTSLWIDTKNHTYGITLNAKILIVEPGLADDVTDAMISSAGFVFE